MLALVTGAAVATETNVDATIVWTCGMHVCVCVCVCYTCYIRIICTHRVFICLSINEARSVTNLLQRNGGCFRQRLLHGLQLLCSRASGYSHPRRFERRHSHGLTELGGIREGRDRQRVGGVEGRGQHLAPVEGLGEGETGVVSE